MADFDVDLFVIGAGSGGTRAARIAAGHASRERFITASCNWRWNAAPLPLKTPVILPAIASSICLVECGSEKMWWTKWRAKSG